MFTGIIEEIGKIEKITPIAGGFTIRIKAEKVIKDLAVNDSVCIDGVCLTVTKKKMVLFGLMQLEQLWKKLLSIKLKQILL